MSIYLCTKCRHVAIDESVLDMPLDVRNGGVGEQMAWMATRPVEEETTLICVNKQCSNYYKRGGSK